MKVQGVGLQLLLPSAPQGPLKGDGDPLCAVSTAALVAVEPLVKLGLVFPKETVIEVARAATGAARVATPNSMIVRKVLFIVDLRLAGTSPVGAS